VTELADMWKVREIKATANCLVTSYLGAQPKAYTAR